MSLRSVLLFNNCKNRDVLSEESLINSKNHKTIHRKLPQLRNSRSMSTVCTEKHPADNKQVHIVEAALNQMYT